MLGFRGLPTLAIVAALSIACNQKNPASPSSVAGAGVSINGTVSAPVPSGLRVTVGGTSNSAQVDGAGQFTITNAPSGTLDLRFSGAASATLVLTDLQPEQSVTLVVTVNGASATLESARRIRGNEEQLEGRIDSVTPPNTLVVAGRTVSTAGATVNASGMPSTFNTLAPGQRITVKGQNTSGALIASQIDIMTPVSAAGVPLSGIIANLSGSREAFQFVVNGISVFGDTNSTFDPGNQFNEMGNGLQIQLMGAPQNGLFYAERLALTSPVVTMSGTITSRTGTAPQLTLFVSGKNIAVTALTDVARKGNPQKATAIATGQTVDVRGRSRSDGVVIAGTINILADAPGGGFWMEGTVTAATGSCPSLRLTVTGYGVDTDAQTVFQTPCGQLAVGDKVEVVGVVRSDLSVMGTSIKKI
jgi:hypothetical protein